MSGRWDSLHGVTNAIWGACRLRRDRSPNRVGSVWDNGALWAGSIRSMAANRGKRLVVPTRDSLHGVTNAEKGATPMASVRYWVHRYQGRTPDIWLVLSDDAGTTVIEVARSRAVLRSDDPSPIPSALAPSVLSKHKRSSRVRVTRIDHLAHKRPGLGLRQDTAEWVKWKSAENPTSSDGALARAREYGHGAVRVRYASVREMRARVRAARAALRPWSSAADRERVEVLRERIEEGIENIRALKGGK